LVDDSIHGERIPSARGWRHPHAARSAGLIDVERVTMRAFLVSGALAGLAEQSKYPV